MDLSLKIEFSKLFGMLVVELKSLVKIKDEMKILKKGNYFL